MVGIGETGLDYHYSAASADVQKTSLRIHIQAAQATGLPLIIHARDADDDGVSDGLDRCIKEPEDKDKFKDADGCPDPDNDADTIPDVKDACPDDPEDNDGYRDTDGCADNDNDSDQILDNDDRCPFDPESYNGVQDTDGCPDADKPKDTDGDRYTDDIDRCPYDAEDFDQDRDEDGCPDEGRVQVGKDRIQITEVIFFDTGKATIQERSNSLIDELAAVIVAHPELTKIRIEQANTLRRDGTRIAGFVHHPTTAPQDMFGHRAAVCAQDWRAAGHGLHGGKTERLCWTRGDIDIKRGQHIGQRLPFLHVRDKEYPIAIRMGTETLLFRSRTHQHQSRTGGALHLRPPVKHHMHFLFFRKTSHVPRQGPFG
jgi:flagellar motor protein MotB